MMKKILCFLIIALFICCLSSCHGTKKEVKKNDDIKGTEYETFVLPESFDTSKEYKITFFSKNDTNQTQKNVYIEAIDDFETLYPNIKVELINYYDYPSIYRDVLVNIPTNTTPNVCITYPDHVAAYKEGNNIIVQLDSLIKDENYGLNGKKLNYEPVGEVVDKFLNECYYQDHLYCLPFMRSSEACYVNVDLVESLGFTMPEILTWDFVWSVCKKGKEVYPNRDFIPLIYKSTDNMAIQLCKQYGIPYSDEEGHILIFNNQMTDLLMELSEYASIFDANKRLFDTFKRVSYPGNYFNKGKCIFAIDSTAGATWMGSYAPLSDIHSSDVAYFNTKVYPIPQKNKDDISMISQGPSLCIFNKENRQEVLASWLFAQFLLSKKVQMGFSSTEGYLPVTKKVINDPDYLAYLNHEDDGSTYYYGVKLEASKLVLNNIERTFITAVFNGSTLLRDAAGSLIEGMFDKNYSGNRENIVKLYSELKTRYHFENLTKPKLSSTAIVLISALGVAWLGLISFGIVMIVKIKKSKSRSKNN